MPCKPKIIIDTDAGIDDAMAIFMALEAHKNNLVEIVAITTVNGNTSVEKVNINVFRILEAAQLLEIPVYSGASDGLTSTFVFPCVPFHGYDGFGDIIEEPPPTSLSLLRKEHAPLALIRIVEENPGEIILIAIGPLTNVAIAMNAAPEWSSLLRDFYVMGGNVHGIGNISLGGEFNFVCDPEAAKVVLERTKIPIKLTPWETCLQEVKISFEERSLMGTSNTPASNLLNKIEETMMNNRENSRYTTWINCDQLSVAWALHDYANCEHRSNQELVTEKKSFYATVEVAGEHTRGQMITDHRNSLNKKENIICMHKVDKGLHMKYLNMAFQ